MSTRALLAEQPIEKDWPVTNGHLSRGDDCAPDLILDEEFCHLLPEHSPEKKAALGRDNLEDGGCLAALVVWKETGILLDGSTRDKICQRLGMAYRVMPGKLDSNGPSESSNGAPESSGKTDHSTDAPCSSGQNDHSNGGQNSIGQSDHLKTEQRLPKEFGVSARLNRRCAEYAAAVDQFLAKYGQPAKARLVSPGAPATKKDALLLAQMGQADQRRFMADLRDGLELPWQKEPEHLFLRVPVRTNAALIAALLAKLGPERLTEIRRTMGEVQEKREEEGQG